MTFFLTIGLIPLRLCELLYVVNVFFLFICCGVCASLITYLDNLYVCRCCCCCCCLMISEQEHKSECGSIDAIDHHQSDLLLLLQDRVAQDRQCPTNFALARMSELDRFDPASCWKWSDFLDVCSHRLHRPSHLHLPHQRQHQRKSRPEVPLLLLLSSSVQSQQWREDEADEWSAPESRKCSEAFDDANPFFFFFVLVVLFFSFLVPNKIRRPLSPRQKSFPNNEQQQLTTITMQYVCACKI